MSSNLNENNKMLGDPMDEENIMKMLDEILNDSDDNENKRSINEISLKLPPFEIPNFIAESPCFQEHLQQDIICAIAEHDNILNTLKQNMRENHPALFNENNSDITEHLNVMNLITEELRDWQPLSEDPEENATGLAVESKDEEMDQDICVTPPPQLNACENCDRIGLHKILFHYDMGDGQVCMRNKKPEEMRPVQAPTRKPNNIRKGPVSEMAKKHSNLMKLLEQDLPDNQIPTFDPDDYIDLGRFGKYAPGEVNHDGDFVDDRRVFAVVGVVKSGSPAEAAGLQTDDMVIEFGYLTSANFNDVQQLKTAVNLFINRPLKIRVKRGRQLLNIMVTPRKWNDPGLIGCQIIRYL